MHHLDLPGTAALPPTEKFAAERRFHLVVLLTFLLLALWVAPEAHAQTQLSSGDFQFPVLDKLFCGFIIYSKSKLAPYIGAIVIIFGVVGHWLGAGKVWGTVLYVMIGLGLITMVGSLVAKTVGGDVMSSCLVTGTM